MDIGSLTGQIAIEDQFSSQLTIAANKVKAFAEDFDGMVGVIAVGAIAAAAAIGGIVTSIIMLGEKGSNINDVAATLNRFAGSAENAEAILSKMREGTLDTVGNMDLMKSSSKLLAAGVNLTADNFKTLSSAAFVLQNQGLGPTKDMLDLVSQAMLTGRTRSLEMKIGKMDLSHAEEDFARKIGTTADQLNMAGKIEAKRTALLEALNKKVHEAGAQERDFGEQLESASAKIENWKERLASAVAASPHVMHALTAIGDALNDAFGGEGQGLIESIVGWIDRFSDKVAEFAPEAVREIASVLAGIKHLYDFLSEHSETLKTLALGVGAYVAAWKLLTFGSALVTGVVEGIKAIGVAAAALEAGSLVGLITPIGLVAAAVGGLVLAVVAFKNEMKGLENKGKPLGTPLSGRMDATGHAVLSLEEGKKAAEKYEKALPPLVDGFSAVIGSTSHAAKTTMEYVDAAKQAADWANTLAGAHDKLAAAQANQSLSGKALALELESQAADIARRPFEDQFYVKKTLTEKQFLAATLELDKAHFIRQEQIEKEWDNKQSALEANRNADNVVSFNDYWLKRQEQNLVGSEKELFEIKRSRDAALDAFGERTEANAAGWDAIWAFYQVDIDRIKLDGDARVEAYYKSMEAGEDSMRRVGGAWAGVSKDIKDDLKSFPQLMIEAFTGGGGFFGALKAWATRISTDILNPLLAKLSTTQKTATGISAGIGGYLGGEAGGTTGAVVGSTAAAIGTSAMLAGSVALGAATLGIGTAVVGIIALAKHFGVSQAEKDARTANRSFEETVGGHGMTFAENVRAAYDKVHIAASVANADVERMWKAEKQGAEAVKSIQEEIAAKINLRSTLDNAASVASSITDKYHFTDNARAADLSKSFQTLGAMPGVDMVEAMKRLGPEFKAMVADAARWHTVLPEEMRPIIQQMADAGQLSQKSVDTLLFGADQLTSPFDLLIDSQKELIAALKYDAGVTLTAAEKTALGLDVKPPTAITDISDAQKHLFNTLTPGAFPGYASGGTVHGGVTGTDSVPIMAMPDEEVLSVSEARAYRAGRRGGGTVIIEVNGRTLAELVVPEEAGVRRRYGLGSVA